MRTFIGNMKKEMITAAIVACFGIAAICILEIMAAKNTAVTHNIELWIEASNFVDFFFPLFVSLPFVWKIYFERKDGFINYISIRTDCKIYLIKKITAGMATVFVMVFVIYYTGLVFAELVVEPQYIAKEVIIKRYMWGQMKMEMPLIFGMFWCSWKSFVGMMICLFGYAISLLSDNLFVISLVPFLYCMLENFVTGTLGLERYSICTTYILDRLSPDAMTVHNYYIGLITFLFAMIIICGMWMFKDKQVDCSEECN